MKFKPLADRIVILPEIVKKETKKGIILPSMAQKIEAKGKVISCGEGKIASHNGLLIPTKVKVGDTVLYDKHAGDKINIEGKDYLIMVESRIIGIV